LELRFRGTFPKDREKMLARVEEAITVWDREEPILKNFA